MDFAFEFLPLAAAIGIVAFVPLIDFPFKRFGYPFLWAILGVLASRPTATLILRLLDLEGLKADTLLLFQGATILAVLAIAIGERLRRVAVPWRPLMASFAILSVPMTELAMNTLNGYGPRPDDLGGILSWVSTAGYVLGPAALAAFVYILGVHRAVLFEEFGKKPPGVTG
jgi:hypothetical protein